MKQLIEAKEQFADFSEDDLKEEINHWASGSTFDEDTTFWSAVALGYLLAHREAKK